MASGITETMRANVQALHEAGESDDATVRRLDELCPPQKRPFRHTLRTWLWRVFLTLLLLDGVLVWRGVEFGKLAVMHALVGFLPTWFCHFFLWFRFGLKSKYSFTQAEHKVWMTAAAPWYWFLAWNWATLAAFAIVDSRIMPEPQPAPPALTCPAPAASAKH